ncbi:MAG: PLP-dependent transferase [Pyrinomonadaceae bacterium]
MRRAWLSRLAEHPQIARVYYPALNEEQDVIKRLLRAPHAGALVTIVLRNDTREGAFRFMDALQLCVRATSLGDVFSAAYSTRQRLRTAI